MDVWEDVPPFYASGKSRITPADSAAEKFTNHIQRFSLKSTMMEQSRYSFTIQQPILIIQHKIISTSQPMYADSQKIKLNAL